MSMCVLISRLQVNEGIVKDMSMNNTNAYQHLHPPPSHPPHHHHPHDHPYHRRTMFPGPLALLSGLFRGTMVGDTNTAREPSSFLLAVPKGREEEGGREIGRVIEISSA